MPPPGRHPAWPTSRSAPDPRAARRGFPRPGPAPDRHSDCVREIRQRSGSRRPPSPGSDWIIRVRMPSVTTSIRVSRPDLRLAPDAVADGLADRLAQGGGHPLGGGAGGQTARFQHHDAARDQTRGEQVQRHPRGLARTGRGLQHGHAAGGHGVAQGGQGVVDGQGSGLGRDLASALSPQPRHQCKPNRGDPRSAGAQVFGLACGAKAPCLRWVACLGRPRGCRWPLVCGKLG